MTISELITQHAAAEAAAGDWPGVAARLNARTIERTSEGRVTSMGMTLAALDASEREPTIAAMSATRVGAAGVTKLAAEGLDFAHPLTVGLIDSLRAANAITESVATKLKRLGRWNVSPAESVGLGTVTPEQCRSAWVTARLHADWTDRLNAIGGINERLSAGDRTEFVAALRAAATWMESTA